MNVSVVNQASVMWRKGVDTKEIADLLGLSKRQVYSMMEYYRDKFPRRQVLEVSVEQIATASRMWLGGLTIPQMRAALNFSEHQIDRMRRLHPDLFPRRVRLSDGYHFPKEVAPVPERVHADRMKFTNASGYVCTMPRVSILMRDMG